MSKRYQALPIPWLLRSLLTADGFVAITLAAASFVLYTLTCAPSVLPGDAGEFQFVPYLLGIAHATGYPLYVLLGWVWSHLVTIADVAYRMNLFSALWASLAVALAYVLALRVTRQANPGLSRLHTRLTASVAATSLAVGITFWRQSVVAEVYSFNTFWVALVLLLVLRLQEAFSFRRGLALALAYGLSLTHHRTMLLLLPGLLTFMWLARRRNPTSELVEPAEDLPSEPAVPRRHRWKPPVALTVAVLSPLLLYLYLPLRAPHVPYATLWLSESQPLTLYSNSWQGFWQHVTGSVFASNLGAFVGQSPAGIDWLERVEMAWQLLHQQYGMAGVALALLGIARLATAKRGSLLALTGVSYLAYLGFNFMYFIGDVHDLFTPTHLLVALWLAVGLAALMRAFTQISAARWAQAERLAGAGALLAFALPATLLITHWPLADRSGDMRAVEMWQPILSQPVPSGAVLVSNDRDEMMPLWYYQYVEGRRPDLLGLFPAIVTEPAYANVGGVLEQAMLSQRPVYLIKPMPGLEVKVQLESPSALPPLVRVLGPAVMAPPMRARQANLGDGVRLVGYDQAPRRVQPGQPLTVTLYWQPLVEMEDRYASYVHVVDGSGRGLLQSDHVPGGDYYPTSFWEPGEVLRDAHTLTVPESLPFGLYRLMAGMYRASSLAALGEPVDLGWLAIKDPSAVLMMPPDDLQHPVNAAFGERITLLGYEGQLSERDLRLTLYWRAERTLDQDWSIFIHMLDDTGNLVAQCDSQPQDGRYPTSVWEPGEVVADVHQIALPASAADGVYQLVVGLYLVADGQRLRVTDPAGAEGADNVPLLRLLRAAGAWQEG